MSRNFDEHLEVTGNLLKRLEEFGVKVKTTKCEWFQEEVEFLGHKVSASGLKKSDKYIEKVLHFPRPRTVRELRAFLGLVEFQRKFMKGCSFISQPLTRWTGKRGRTMLTWSDEMVSAFEELKNKAAEDVELAYPDYSDGAEPIELYTDASGYCMGGCLTQVQQLNGDCIRRVIGYVSKCFNSAERNYSTLERELAAIRYCVKAFKSFLYGMKFVIRTDHQPLVYLNRMKSIDSRIARTIEDLSDFDYEIQYTPGNRNEIADLMSRFPGTLEKESFVDSNYLPAGLRVMNQGDPYGSCDSMFKSVYCGLEYLYSERMINKAPPKAVDELRILIVEEAIKRPEILGMVRCKRLMKELRALRIPQSPPFQELLMVVSKFYNISVFVHFGGLKPIIYRHDSVKFETYGTVLHLQFVFGIHYNWVKADWQFTQPDNGEDHRRLDSKEDSEEFEEISTEVIADVNLLYSADENVVDIVEQCEHDHLGAMMCRSNLEGHSHCVMIDSGAQISLIRRNVVERLSTFGINLKHSPVNITIKGLSRGQVMAMESVAINFVTERGDYFSHHAVILENDAMPCCILLGIDFLRRHQLSIDVGNGLVFQQGKSIMKLNTGCVSEAFAGVIQVDLDDDREILSELDIMEIQDRCEHISELKRCLLKGTRQQDWPSILKLFKRYAKGLVVCMDTVYYSKLDPEGDRIYVPALSLTAIIGLTMIVHERNGHLGKHKLLRCMKGVAFHPHLMKICFDVAVTCTVCQRRKLQSPVVKPPLLKIEASETFEIVVADCVSMPTTSRGHIGMLVAVDHKSKFAYVGLLKNKTSKHVTEVMSERLLPMMIQEPKRMLTDNGPEFKGTFKKMLRRSGIHHTTISPYVASSNGLSERTIKTITELLKVVDGPGREWDEDLARVLWSYNATLHSAHGTSPSQYLWKFQKSIKPNIALSEEDQKYWRACHERFKSFKVGDYVMKSKVEIGRLNINKLAEKFEGPYKVTQVWSNELSYVLEKICENGEIEKVRAHQSQLRTWREPPDYLKFHPVYKMLKEKRQHVEDAPSELDFAPEEGEVLIMIEKKKKKPTRKSKRLKKKNESSNKDLLNDFSDIGKMSSKENDFEGF